MNLNASLLSAYRKHRNVNKPSSRHRQQSPSILCHHTSSTVSYTLNDLHSLRSAATVRFHKYPTRAPFPQTQKLGVKGLGSPRKLHARNSIDAVYSLEIGAALRFSFLAFSLHRYVVPSSPPTDIHGRLLHHEAPTVKCIHRLDGIFQLIRRI